MSQRMPIWREGLCELCCDDVAEKIMDVDGETVEMCFDCYGQMDELMNDPVPVDFYFRSTYRAHKALFI